MNWSILIIIVVLITMGTIIIYLNKDSYRSWPDYMGGTFYILAFVLLGVFLSPLFYNKTLKSDDYRITIQIVDKDSIPIDSIMIFKK